MNGLGNEPTWETDPYGMLEKLGMPAFEKKPPVDQATNSAQSPSPKIDKRLLLWGTIGAGVLYFIVTGKK